MQPVAHFKTIVKEYDAFLLDLWGVVHDGSQLYPGVFDAITELNLAAKKIVFISNAPRRAHKVVKVLSQLGISPQMYTLAVSSGEVGYQWLAEGKAPWGKRYYFLGAAKDADIADGLSLSRTDDIKAADFIINCGFGVEEQTVQDYASLLRAAKSLSIPMLCLNPDLEVVKISGERFPCAGMIAKEYERMGGSVTWFGKPYGGIYESCMIPLGGMPKNRILAVGDSLETDIPGAQQFAIDAALVTGGILKHQTQEEIEAACAAQRLSPRYVMPALAW